MLLLACLSGVSTLLIIVAAGVWFCERPLRFYTIVLGATAKKKGIIAFSPVLAYCDEKIFQAGMQVTSTILLLLLIAVIFLSYGVGMYLVTEHRLLSGMALSVFALILVHKGIDFKINRRKRQIESQMPDVLVLLSNSLRSGLSLLQALEMVATEVRPPVSQEFCRVLKEIRFGISIEDALSHMNRRLQNPDFELVITALHVHRSLGGNLAVVLDKVAAAIYERLAIRDELRTLTIQGRMSGWIIGVLPIISAVMIYILNPGYLFDLLYDSFGRMLLIGSVVLEFIGIVIIRRVTSPKI